MTSQNYTVRVVDKT